MPAFRIRKSQVGWKGHVLFIFTIHTDSSLNSQNTVWCVITNCIFIWTITGSITYILDEPFIRFPHFSAFLVTPWSRVLLEKLTSSQLVKKFPTFYGTHRSLPHLQVPVTCHLSVSWVRSILTLPPSHFLKIHLDIILPSMPGSSKWSFSLRFPHQNPVYTSPLPHTCYIPRPSNFSWFDHPNTWDKVCRSVSSVCSYLLLSPNILLSTLFSYTLSLCSSLNVTDQVSHPHKTTGKIIFLYTLICIIFFFNSKLEDTRFCTEW